MEPMNLGSPPSSPSSPMANPNFLPPFLIGEPQPSTPAPSSISPGRNKSMGSAKVGFSTTEPRSLRQKLFNQSVSEMSYSSSPHPGHNTEKHGPPKLGLFDTIESKKMGSPLLSSTVQNLGNASFNDSFSRVNESFNQSHTFNESFRSTATAKGDGDETLWVTVFGFPPSSLSIILSHFANCGTIVDKKCPTQGNWVHLKFMSFSEVNKALSFNGKLITNGIMVGVLPFSNREGKENLNASVYSTTPRARSLRQSFVTLPSANTVTSPQNVPQKSTGLVTKAMEYVFGW